MEKIKVLGLMVYSLGMGLMWGSMECCLTGKVIAGIGIGILLLWFFLILRKRE